MMDEQRLLVYCLKSIIIPIVEQKTLNLLLYRLLKLELPYFIVNVEVNLFINIEKFK